MATRQTLYIDQGTTYSLEIEVSDSSDSSIDLSQYEIISQIRKSPSSKKFESFDVSYQNELLTLTLEDKVSAGMSPGRYFYDVILYVEGEDIYGEIPEDPEGGSHIGVIGKGPSETIRLMEGQIILLPGITRT